MARGRAMGAGRLWKRGTTWILDYRDAKSSRHQLALGPDKRVAERRRHELISRRNLELDGLAITAGQDLLLIEIADRYLEDLARRATPQHCENVATRLARSIANWPDKRVRDLRAIDAIGLRADSLKGGASNRTANLVVESLRAALRWAVDAELIAANPLARVKKLPENGEHRRYRRRALSETEVERFLAGVRADDVSAEHIAGNRNRDRVPQEPLFMALLDTGARWSELRRVRWMDVDLTAALLVLRAENTKGRKQRVIPLTGRLVLALRDLQVLHARVHGHIATATDWVFLSPDGCAWGRPTNNPMRIFDRVLERAGIARIDAQGQKLDIHALRHAFATRLARHGVALVHAQRLLGHSDPKLTAQVYQHLDAEDLRGAIATLDRSAAKANESAHRTPTTSVGINN